MQLHGLFMEETFGEILHAITWAIYGGDFRGDITCYYMGYSWRRHYMLLHGLFMEEIFGEILHLLHGLFMEETFGEILHAITWAIYRDFRGDITCYYMGYL